MGSVARVHSDRSGDDAFSHARNRTVRAVNLRVVGLYLEHCRNPAIGRNCQ